MRSGTIVLGPGGALELAPVPYSACGVVKLSDLPCMETSITILGSYSAPRQLSELILGAQTHFN